jgi:hypothetical protein
MMAENVFLGITNNPATVTNWSLNHVPADGEPIRFSALAVYMPTGYDVTAGGTIQTPGFVVEEGCTGPIGSASVPFHIDLKDGGSYYSVNYAGTGTSFLQIDNADSINITNAASGTTGTYGLTLTGVNDSSTLAKINIRCPATAKISIGTSVAGSCEANSITVAGGIVAIRSGVVAYDGAAAPNLTMSGGTVTTNCPLATVTKYGGSLTTQAGAITSLTGNGGNTYHTSTGTLTAGVIGGTEIFDCSSDLRAKTITSFTVQGSSATYKDPNKVITNTNPIQLKGGAKASQLDMGTDCGIARSALA